MLLRRIVHEDVDRAQLSFRFRNRPAAEIFVPDVAGNQNAFAPLAFDEPLRLASVFVLIEIHDPDVGPFLRVQDRHRAPDPAVATRDERDAVPQFSRADIIAGS